MLSETCHQAALNHTDLVSLAFVGCESFLESNFLDILALCETNPEDSIDPSKFFLRVYLPLTWKDSFTSMFYLALAVFMK